VKGARESEEPAAARPHHGWNQILRGDDHDGRTANELMTNSFRNEYER
jgi:hypothetical protein